ncbi:MAG: hypothetical protein L3J83_01015 [Proteobacteria bacterium]|nr:hypothetical protein [Pseudomonadota bacterium]
MNVTEIIYMAVFVLVVTPILLLMFRALALRFGLVDVPDSRKIHKSAIPVVGGLVLFIVAAVLLLVVGNVNRFTFYLMMSSGFVVVVGLMDDVFLLSAFWRFMVQIIASLVVVYFSTVQLNSFGFLLSPSWDLQLGFMAIPITVFGVVGVINALNMADGIDGLAAMTFVFPVLAMGLLSLDASMSLWLFLLVGSVVIFVVFNKSRAYKVFLGDSGSLLLGFILAWLLVYFSQGSSAIMKPITALYLVALPVYDTIFVMLKRILNGDSPFKPDKSHLHHLFLAYGFSQSKALFAMMNAQLAFIVLGIMFSVLAVPEYFQFYCFVLIALVYYFFMKKMWAIQNIEPDATHD